MVDTNSKTVRRPLSEPIVNALAVNGVMRNDDWYISSSPSLDRQGRPRTKLFGQGPADIIIQGHNNVIELVQASVPHCLHGSNGTLIRTPEDLKAGLAEVDALLDPISIPEEPLIEHVRLDLVLHFRGNAQKFFNAHRHARHPAIRNETVVYDGSGIVLPGVKATIRMYDKQLQMTGKPGDVLRLEIQLRKPKLNEVFGRKDRPLVHLDFAHSGILSKQHGTRFLVPNCIKRIIFPRDSTGRHRNVDSRILR